MGIGWYSRGTGFGWLMLAHGSTDGNKKKITVPPKSENVMVGNELLVDGSELDHWFDHGPTIWTKSTTMV